MGSLQIGWINHASFLAASGETKLVCDPWLEGTAFKDGWSLVTPTVFRYADFRDVTHLWLSHQHPDHFAPTNLKRIDPAIRRAMTVLYQETRDKLVVNWCKSAGFGTVRELPPDRWYTLSAGVDVMCGTVGDDSWLAVRTPDAVMLNVNDCVLKTRERIETIARAVGRINVLFTQFSYAQWTGNPPDVDLRRRAAAEKYDRIRLQAEILQPEIIVPFASFVYFCHEQNFYLNDAMNAVEDVASYIEADLGKKAVVLYPGETWSPPGSIAWKAAAQRYASDLAKCLARGPLFASRRVERSEFEAYVNAFLSRLRFKNRRARRLISGKTSVFLTDLGTAYDLSIDGMKPCGLSQRETDIVTSTETVLYAFRTPWGGNTLHVSGRFMSWRNTHSHFFAFMRKVHYYNVTPVNAVWLRALAARAIRSLARRAAALVPRHRWA